MIYLIGSLRNEKIPHIGASLRQAGFEVFDDWWGAGERADDAWKEYETIRGRTYKEALRGAAAETIFDFDLRHLKLADAVVLVLPAGRSGHMELAWSIGMGKRGFIFIDSDNPACDTSRWDLMYKFAHLTGGDVVYSVEELLDELK